MRLLVIGAGMMGSAAVFDMARSARVEQITIADSDLNRASTAAKRINRLTGPNRVKAVRLDAANARSATALMRKHDGALSAVPYFFNVDLARAAVAAKCHFADLGGNNDVVRKELALGKQAAKSGVRLAPDCGLSPGLASILGGELMRRIDGRADALKIYVGGLPLEPRPPLHYQLVFSVEGLINEYSEPAKILRNGKVTTVEPLTEIETFRVPGFPELEAFHTSGGTSTLPESFAGRVGECFEKTLRYPGHAARIRALYDFGLFSRTPRKLGKQNVVPCEFTASLLQEKFSGNSPDVTVLRVEAHKDTRVFSFTLVDKYDPDLKMTSMMRTTAWPASIVLQMLVSGEVTTLGAVLQEKDIPAQQFLAEMSARSIAILFDAQGEPHAEKKKASTK